MNILITGGAGYIGSHAVQVLTQSGHRAVVLDTLEYGHRAAIADTPLIVGNTGNRALVADVLVSEGIDAVMHFAAYKAPGESMQQPERYFENNVASTLSLLHAMVQTGVKKLVFSSTAAVYGTPDELPVSEQSALRPENPYGVSKMMVEQMLNWFDVCHGLRSVVLRYFNAAGAALDGSIGEDWTYTLNLIPVVMKAAILGHSPVRVFGTDYPTPDGTAIRDYIHVLDLVDAHVKALDYLAHDQPSNIFNLGTGTGSSVKQIIDIARRYTDFEVEYTARRPGDPAAVMADSRRAHALLGWQPRYSIHETIDSAWRWHSAHPQGFEDRQISASDACAPPVLLSPSLPTLSHVPHTLGSVLSAT